MKQKLILNLETEPHMNWIIVQISWKLSLRSKSRETDQFYCQTFWIRTDIRGERSTWKLEKSWKSKILLGGVLQILVFLRYFVQIIEILLTFCVFYISILRHSGRLIFRGNKHKKICSAEKNTRPSRIFIFLHSTQF